MVAYVESKLRWELALGIEAIVSERGGCLAEELAGACEAITA